MAVDLSSRRERATISQINVTPFVDVMLVLLVIFMITAPILQQGVQVNLPEAKAGAVAGKEKPLVVSITKNGQIYLNDNRMKLTDLRKKLRAIVKIQQGKEVFLRADRNVHYGVVMQAIAAIKEAGVVKLGMITQPPGNEG